MSEAIAKTVVGALAALILVLGIGGLVSNLVAEHQRQIVERSEWDACVLLHMPNECAQVLHPPS